MSDQETNTPTKQDERLAAVGSVAVGSAYPSYVSQDARCASIELNFPPWILTVTKGEAESLREALEACLPQMVDFAANSLGEPTPEVAPDKKDRR